MKPIKQKFMNNLSTLLLLFVFFNCSSQSRYYTTDGINRMTEAEIKTMLSETGTRMEKALGKTVYPGLTIQSTETKKDSVISKVSFNFSDKKEGESANSDPLSTFLNKSLPGLTLEMLTGESLRMNQLKGKPTMINFWFTTCAPCIDEMPVLNQIAERYKNEVNFIAITYESDKEVANFLKKHPFNFEHLINGQSFIDSLRITAFPRNLFLDKEGILKYIESGIPYERLDNGKLVMGDGKALVEIIGRLK